MPQLGQEWASTRSASTSPTPNGLHWAAGFLEGEGTFGFRGATATIHAAQTENPAPLGRLLALFGGSVTIQDREAAVGVVYALETVRCGP